MKFKELAVVVVIGLFATTVWSGEENHHKMKIEVVSDGGDGETHLVLDSDELGFNLHDIQVGENQSVVDGSGRAVLIARNEEGFSFEIDGKTIEMLAFDGAHQGMDVHSCMAPPAMMDEETVMIVSGKTIDSATQQIIQTALESTGYENVHFAGGHEGGPHQIRVVEKVLEVSE